MDSSFILERIEVTKALIVAYEDAGVALATGIQSYTIDTGQTQQTVTKVDAARIQRIINSLYNRCATLEARLNGGGSITARPCW